MSHKISQDIKERIKSGIVINGNGCWIWQKAKSSRGYGQIWDGKTSQQTHRMSYKAFVKDPSNFHVLHRCDVPLCCNPEHLFLGDDRDNLNDAYQKGRRGKISPEKKVELKADILSGFSDLQICSKYGVTGAGVWYWRNKFRKDGSNGN